MSTPDDAIGKNTFLLKCQDCGQFFHFLEGDKWCEDCFEKGLHQDMNDHFRNFVEQEMTEDKNPDEARRIEAAAEEFEHKVMNDLESPDHPAFCFKAGVAWARQNESPEVLALVNACTEYLANCGDVGFDELSDALANYKQARKGRGEG